MWVIVTGEITEEPTQNQLTRNRREPRLIRHRLSLYGPVAK
jgi:hypothetical protein